MRRIPCAFPALGLLLAATVTLRADDSANARALVDKAIKAQGGDAKLTKLPAATAKFKGTFHGLGQAIPMTGEVTTQMPERQKLVVEGTVNGQKFHVIHVLNGDKGWIKINDATKEMDKDELAEAKEQMHAEWVTVLVPLTGKEFTLATVGEVKVEDRPALGVMVSFKGRRDINLYFDKETGLLVKRENRVKDDNGKEVAEETFLSDYKDVQDTKQAMKFIVKRDGKLYMEGEVTEYQLAEKLDGAVFAKP